MCAVFDLLILAAGFSSKVAMTRGLPFVVVPPFSHQQQAHFAFATVLYLTVVFAVFAALPHQQQAHFLNPGFAPEHFFDTNLVCLPRQQQAHFALATVLYLTVVFSFLPHYATNKHIF